MSHLINFVIPREGVESQVHVVDFEPADEDVVIPREGVESLYL